MTKSMFEGIPASVLLIFGVACALLGCALYAVLFHLAWNTAACVAIDGTHPVELWQSWTVGCLIYAIMFGMKWRNRE